jgi:hypothetical protein
LKQTERIERTCALRAPTVFSVRIRAKTAWACFYTRSPIACGRILVRTQSAIRADGPPSAQARAPQFEVSSDACRCRQAGIARAPRANHVFGTDEKHIRIENMVIDKSNNGLGSLLSNIADCARMRFSSVHNRRSARTASRPRNNTLCKKHYR